MVAQLLERGDGGAADAGIILDDQDGGAMAAARGRLGMADAGRDLTGGLLGGGSGALHSYLSRTGRTITGTTPPKPWVVPEQPIDTPWVSVPGLLTAECKTNENATFLEITVHGNPADPRTDDIIGDIGSAARPAANWGLHLIDMNLAMGNLLDIVGEQAKVYKK